MFNFPQMKIFVKAKPKAKRKYLKQIDENHFEIAVNEPAEQGKANQAIIKVLAEYLNVSRSQLEIISGREARQKIIKLNK